MNARARLFKELRDIQRTQKGDSCIQLLPDENDIFRWRAVIKVCSIFFSIPSIPFSYHTNYYHSIYQGPSGTPFEGGSFLVSLNVPEAYPMAPPTARYQTRIFHPNVHFKVCPCALLTSRTGPYIRTHQHTFALYI